jgi:hypothetical protein
MNQEQMAAAMAQMQRMMAAGAYPAAMQGGVPGESCHLSTEGMLVCLCQG